MDTQCDLSESTFSNELDKLVIVDACHWDLRPRLNCEVLDVSYKLLSVFINILSEVSIGGRLQGFHVCCLLEIAGRDKICSCSSVIRLVGLVAKIDAVFFLPCIVNVVFWPHDLLTSLVLCIEVEPRLELHTNLSCQLLSAALLYIHGSLAGMIEVIVLQYDARWRDIRLGEATNTEAKVRLWLQSLVLIAYRLDPLVMLLSRLMDFVLEVMLSG